MNYRPALLASALLLTSLNVQATLTSYKNEGADLVHSSVSNVTWTKDANLFATMANAKGFDNLVNAIIAASPVIHDSPNIYDFPVPNSGARTLRRNQDFFSSSGLGRVSWWGAMGFVNYLNSINYGGSNDWRLPTVTDIGNDGCNSSNGGTDCGYNVATNGAVAGDEFAELYYNELGGKAAVSTSGTAQPGFGLPNTATFDNEQKYYWSGTEYVPSATQAWMFFTSNGQQGSMTKASVDRYVWAVTPGQIAAVPEPESLAMLLAGLGLVGVAARRRHMNTKQAESFR